MHPRRWAWSAGVAKLAHGRASLGRQLRQNTRIARAHSRSVIPRVRATTVRQNKPGPGETCQIMRGTNGPLKSRPPHLINVGGFREP